MPITALVRPVDQALLRLRLAEPVGDHPEDGLLQVHALGMGEAGQHLIEAQLCPELAGDEDWSVLAHLLEPQLAEPDAAAALGGGELAKMLDEAVNLSRREQIAAAEAAQHLAYDLALDLVLLDDVQVLVDAVSVLAAAYLDEHGSCLP
jgi:hypothetical protein